MEEQKNTNLNIQNEHNKAKNEKHKKAGFAEKVQDYKAEFKKIVWPNRKDTAKKTLTVIVTSLIMAGIIFLMDTVYTGGYDAILGFLTSK